MSAPCRIVLYSGFDVFGYSLLIHTRSRCPGNHLVDSFAWLSIANMLATLDIRKKRDENGVEIEPVVKFENSVFRSVLVSFGCRFVVRFSPSVCISFEWRGIADLSYVQDSKPVCM